MTVTTTSPVSTGTSATTAAGDEKGIFDFLGDVLPDLAGTAAQAVGIDPRVAGQTVSQILSIFGIGGGKAFAPGLPKDQAVSQLQQILTPQLLSDPTFKAALTKWMQAAIEPIQAQKENKEYKPSVPLENKDWFGDAINSIGHAVSSVNWGQVAQVGMQALPFVLSLF